jgi:hypothetical protein
MFVFCASSSSFPSSLFTPSISSLSHPLTWLDYHQFIINTKLSASIHCRAPPDRTGLYVYVAQLDVACRRCLTRPDCQWEPHFVSFLELLLCHLFLATFPWAQFRSERKIRNLGHTGTRTLVSDLSC